MKKLLIKYFQNIILCLWALPIVSWIVVAYWTYDVSEYHEFSKKHKNIADLISVSATINLVIVLLIGFENYLFFIPEQSGVVDEDGGWRSSRYIIGLLLAVGMTFFFQNLLYNKFNKK